MAEAEPVIIDDGGSTRIKQIRDGGKMDDLLGTSAGGATVFVDRAGGEFERPAGTFKCTLKIRYHEVDGSHHILPDAPVGTPSGLVLLHDDRVDIVSTNGQKAALSFDAANRLVVTLSASVAGIDPIVEAKQNGKQRRYIVINAGPILTVTHVRGAVSKQVFPDPAAPLPISIYTMIHLRPRDP